MGNCVLGVLTSGEHLAFCAALVVVVDDVYTFELFPTK